MGYHYEFIQKKNNSDASGIQVLPNQHYDRAIGYGYYYPLERSKSEDGHTLFPGDYAFATIPSFVVKVPNGNYKVTVTLGNKIKSSSTTVKTGSGRLVLQEIKTNPGEFQSESFAVNVNDGYFKIAFLGESPCVQSVEFDKTEMPTLFLAGDSTVTDQPSGQYPYTGWGQMLPIFLSDKIAVSNHARSGRSSKSFIDEGRLNQIWEEICPGDYLFIQFGHNDQKNDERGTEPYSTYQTYLKQYIDGARERGAIPVLITSMHRRKFDNLGKIVDTHGDYIHAMKQLSQVEKVDLLDLHDKSKYLYEKLGPVDSKQLFMWTHKGEFENFPDALEDDTHFNQNGAIAIANLVVECLKETSSLPKLYFR